MVVTSAKWARDKSGAITGVTFLLGGTTPAYMGLNAMLGATHVAQLLELSRNTVYRYMSDGTLPRKRMSAREVLKLYKQRGGK